MTQAASPPRRSEDFNALYDLSDPRAYYRGLAPSAYAMPERVAAAVRALAGDKRPYQLLDLACGYGAVGLLLRTGLGMADLYRRYADEAGASDGAAADDAADSDAAAFDAAAFDAAAFDATAGDWRIGGLDIAGRALAYGQAVGAIDVAFCENVLEAPPSAALSAFLRDADLIVESGAVGGLLDRALPRLIAAAAPNRPAILYCPRPDVDPAPIEAALAAVGYAVAPFGPPVAYRRPLEEAERRAVAEAAAAHGLSPDQVYDADGFMQVQMRVARSAG